MGGRLLMRLGLTQVQTAEGAEEPRTDIALRASKLIERGFTVLAEHIVNTDLIIGDSARTLTRSRLRELNSQAEGAGCSFDQQYKCSEIERRQRHRTGGCSIGGGNAPDLDADSQRQSSVRLRALPLLASRLLRLVPSLVVPVQRCA